MITRPRKRRKPAGRRASIGRMAPTPVPSDAPDPLVALADRCVQCGLCLPHCPTYQLDRCEAESPRGRIALARGLATGRLAPSAAGDAHLDHCLGCRRCEAVCPAGVRYGELLVETRRRQRLRRRPGLRRRLAEWLTARPALLDRGLGLYRILAPLLPARLRPLPRPPATRPRPAGPARVAVFTGCVARRYEAPVQAALARLCAALDTAIAWPEGQTCCGALHAHAGDTDTAQRLAATNRAAFAGAHTVLTCASGCHAAVAASLPEGVRARDALDFLHERCDRLHFRPLPIRLALHLPCTQRSVVGSDRALRALLARIPALEVVELPDTGCCGAAGMHMFDDPMRAARLRQPLLDALAASGAATLVSANIGCRLHLADAAGIRTLHPLELLADALPCPPPAITR